MRQAKEKQGGITGKCNNAEFVKDAVYSFYKTIVI